MAFWERNYAPGESVLVLEQNEWKPGKVNANWQPAPGFGVSGAYNTGGEFLADRPGVIRHA
jgi:hypothetical protein